MLFPLHTKNLTFAFNVYHIYAGVAELADAPDLGSGAFGFVGSNPSIRTGIFFNDSKNNIVLDIQCESTSSGEVRISVKVVPEDYQGDVAGTFEGFSKDGFFARI